MAAYNAGDYAEAAKWHSKAAEQRHRGAQYNLGVMCDYAYGVLHDTIAAHIWFNIAGTNGGDRSETAVFIGHRKSTADGVTLYGVWL